MRTQLIVLVGGLLGACVGEPESTSNSGSPCAEGFEQDFDSGSTHGYCVIGRYSENVDADDGIYGFVKAVDGGCGPGDNACVVTFEDDYPVEVYAIDEVLTVEECRSADRMPLGGPVPSPVDALGLEPIQVIHTDAEGRFWAALLPGSYCVTAIDTVDDGRDAKVVTVDGLTNATFVFDHGAI